MVRQTWHTRLLALSAAGVSNHTLSNYTLSYTLDKSA